MWPSNPNSPDGLVGLRADTFGSMEQEQAIYIQVDEHGRPLGEHVSVDFGPMHGGVLEPGVGSGSGSGAGPSRLGPGRGMRMEERRVANYMLEMAGIPASPNGAFMERPHSDPPSVFLGLEERTDVWANTPPVRTPTQNHGSIGMERREHGMSAHARSPHPDNHLPSNQGGCQNRAPWVTNHVTGRQTYCRAEGAGTLHPHEACSSWPRGANYGPDGGLHRTPLRDPSIPGPIVGGDPYARCRGIPGFL